MKFLTIVFSLGLVAYAKADCCYVTTYSGNDCTEDHSAPELVKSYFGRCMNAQEPDRHSFSLSEGCVENVLFESAVDINYYEDPDCSEGGWAFFSQSAYKTDNDIMPGCHNVNTGMPWGSSQFYLGYGLKRQPECEFVGGRPT